VPRLSVCREEPVDRGSDIQRSILVVAFLCTMLLAAGCWYATSFEAAVAFALLTVSAAIPIMLWLRRGAVGIPVLAVTAALYFIYYAIPLLRSDPILLLFTDGEILGAAVSVVIFLVVAIFACELVCLGRRPIDPGEESAARISYFMFAGFGLGMFYFAAVIVGAIASFGPLVGLLRAVFLTATGIASFLLGFAIAAGAISGVKRAVAVACLVGVLIMSLSTLFLVAGGIYIGAAILGYVVKQRRVPWLTIVAVCAALFVLNAGKEGMRRKYWLPNANYGADMSILAVPTLVVEWVSEGANAIISGSSYQNVVDRASLIKLLLIVRRVTPERVPYLQGESYSYLPYMLVPRFVQSDKMVSQASMILLNIRFGFQTEEGAASTAIGWGLVPEAYANYGNVAVAIIAAIFGAGAGLLNRMSAVSAVISPQTFVAVVALITALNVEADFSYLITNMFQSCIAALIFYGVFHFLRSARGITVARDEPEVLQAGN
jgi:hypothetical protein